MHPPISGDPHHIRECLRRPSAQGSCAANDSPRLRTRAINILIGYGYHPLTTATYLQRALERRADALYVGTPARARAGFAATSDLREIIADLPVSPDLYLHVDSGAAWYFPRGLPDVDCPTACYLIDVHVQPKIHVHQAMFFDYAFSAQRDFVETLRRLGHPNAYWLPLACDPGTHRRYDVPKQYDIGFVGATGGSYTRRTALLERLEQRFTVNDYRRTYTPEEMSRLYSAARLVFNCSLRHEVNMRVFEGPATGTLLLTDRIGNGLADLVTDGLHVVMYDDHTLIDLAEEYVRDNAARQRISSQGYEHVHAHHTYDVRAKQILSTVFDHDGEAERDAPLRRVSKADADLAYGELCALIGRVDDTIEQLKRMPPSWRYRLHAARQVAFSLVRRVKLG